MHPNRVRAHARVPRPTSSLARARSRFDRIVSLAGARARIDCGGWLGWGLCALVASSACTAVVACTSGSEDHPCRRPSAAATCESPDGRADVERGAATDAARRAPDASSHAASDDAASRVSADAKPFSSSDGAASADASTGAGASADARAALADAAAVADGAPLALSGDLTVHDPAIIAADGQYVLFATGPGIGIKCSADLHSWRDSGRVFAVNPSWIAARVPGATDLWAPDISLFGGSYHLYYSASTFGSRASCIGHATAEQATGPFVDRGPVICSRETDDWNAIDPNLVVDDTGQAWLAFGSFWSGIKLIRLDANGARQGTEFHAIASRDGDPIEAPYVVRRGEFYYLFVSFDYCCRGADSTYRVMVGRSESVLGPYVDAEGKPLLDGGGTLAVAGDERWRGPGHNAALLSADGDYLVYHAYDAAHDGVATLRILPLAWDAAGWPVRRGP